MLRLRWVVLVLLLATGCAYFNVFYNAKQHYGQGEDERKRNPDAAGVGAASYRACIEKCVQLLRLHPNSGHVDDALFLIGMSHFHLGEYVQSQASFQDLLERFPDSDFAERSYFHMGLAALYMEDAAGASDAFEKLRERLPDSNYNLEAIFRTAEMRMNTHDFDTAREELRSFMETYPKSRFVVDAQVLLARTYYDEQRYEEARQEYEAVLKRDVTNDLQYEARLHIALSRREQATSVLADPSLYTPADLPKGLQLEAGGEIEPVPTPPPGASEQVPPDPRMGAEDQPPSPEGQPPPPPQQPVRRVNDPEKERQREAAIRALPESLQVVRRGAESMLDQAERELQAIDGLARKLGRGQTHRIELAVTRAMLGYPEQALDELDQIARERANTAVAAQAYYEIGEIHRRDGNFAAARTAYDQVMRQRQGGKVPVTELARAKSAAIQSRAAAAQKLKDRDKVLREWRIMNGLEPPDEPRVYTSARDSVEARVTAEREFEAMASQLMRLAEVDLFELDQPRLALREFQRVLQEFPGSQQCPRAAFAIAWIYDNTLADTQRALRAYESVAAEYPESVQARQAQDIVSQMLSGVPRSGRPDTTEVPQSSRP
jgi:TolA-binding protein